MNVIIYPCWDEGYTGPQTICTLSGICCICFDMVHKMPLIYHSDQIRRINSRHNMYKRHQINYIQKSQFGDDKRNTAHKMVKWRSWNKPFVNQMRCLLALNTRYGTLLGSIHVFNTTWCETIMHLVFISINYTLNIIITFSPWSTAS